VGCLKEPCSKSPDSKVVSTEFVRPVACLKEPCAACPSGESRNGKGVCAALPIVAQQCQSGEFWNGAKCVPNYTQDQCALARQAAEELRINQERVQMACAGSTSTEQECNDAKQQYEAELQSYNNSWLNGNNSARPGCQVALPNPLSLGLNEHGKPSPHEKDKTAVATPAPAPAPTH
jgi:hypothetical protein